MEFPEDNVPLLELLPIEVVEVISHFLTGEELAACCATNHKWRDIFNVNIMWKHRCDISLALYLKNTPCNVEPKFVNPESGNTMDPICEWRLAYMRENHLRNNWVLGRYKEQLTRKTLETKFSTFNFHDNDYVIGKCNDRIEIFDVRKLPYEIVISIPFPDIVGFRLKIESAKDMIITIYKSLVAVFYLSLDVRQYSLKHMFFFDSPDKLSFNYSEELKIWHSEMNRIMDPRISVSSLHITNENIFVGSIYREGSTMYIWNLTSGHKIKEEPCPLKGHCTLEHFKLGEPNCLFVVYQHDGECSHSFLVYNLEQLVFLPFRHYVSDLFCYSVLGQYFLITNQNTSRIYNFHTSELVFEIQAHGYPEILCNDVVFLQDNVLKIFTPSTQVLRVLCQVNTSKFKVISNKFIEFNNEIWLIEGKSNKRIKKTALGSVFMERKTFSQLNIRCVQQNVQYWMINFGEVWHFW